ncbi:MAG TPA: ATP-binding protein [Anaeromyxobacteraceae bacterium]|nr:ATP-binding protein [Anaeromyxobacteraceae bacterium]
MAQLLMRTGAAAVESMAEGVIIRDASGTVLTVNPAAEAILGVSSAQLRGVEPVDPRWRLIREDGTALLSADQPSAQVIASGQAVRGQLIGVHRPDGSVTWVRASAEPIRGPDGALTGVVGTCSDVTATERRRRVDQARLRLLALSPDATLEEVLRATIDEAERLTGSRIGFFHFVGPEEQTLLLQTWSTNTLERMCTAEGAGQHYPVAQAGVWADALRECRPVVHNEYASLPGRKGLPPGHAQVVREAVVPVFREGRVCAMLGVGNKDTDYVQGDVDEVSLLADLAWDIASRKRTEEALRASEAALRQERERLARAVEAGKVGLWELDLGTGRAWRTLEHDQIFGYDEIQPTWGPPEALAHVVPEDRHLFEEAFERARRTGIFHYELRIAPPGKPRRWIVADGKVVSDPSGEPVRMVGTVVDVTDRRDAEEAVGRNERLYRAVAHHYPLGVVGLFDVNLRLLLLDGQRPVVVPDPSVAIGKRPSEFAPPEVAALLENLFREALAGRSGWAEIRPGDRVVEVSTHPIRGDDGEVVLGLVLTEDVTSRRALEGQVATTSRLAALGTLVAGVAHEINNPLAAVTSGLGLALEGAEGRLDDVTEALRDAQAAAQRIARIVKDMALMARADGRRERVALRDAVDLALRWLPGGLVRGVEIRVEDSGTPEVEASEGQLEQVVANLVANAAKAIPPGRPGVVTVRLGPGRPGMARLEVEDDGAGMSPELVRRIFDPFFTTRRVGDGTGLGLPVAHSIVTAHGGSIEVRSREGVGTNFRVELPTVKNPRP